ncbi:MOP flippase family protein [Winogradskyella sp. PC D3.3]
MSVKKKAIAGVKWTTLSTIVIAITSIVKLSVLTRYLDKEDFGLMALVTVVLGFMSLFMDMGITTSILHVQNIKKKEYASLYWLNFLFSIVLFLLIALSAPIIANFYNEPELVPLLQLMGVSLLISAFGRQFKTIEQKELNFKFISGLDIASAIVSLIVAIVLAVKGFGVYTLVYSALTQFALSNLVLLLSGVKKHGLLFHFNFSETKRFLRIGMYQVGGQIVNYFNRDLDTLLVGKLLGAEILGGYSLAKQLVFRPASLISPILTKVAAPSLALFQNDKVALKRNYLKLLNIVSSLNLAAYLMLALFAPIIVALLYGDAFVYIVPIVQILSVYMYLRSIGNPVGSLVIATGRTELEFYWNIFSLVFMPIFIFAGSFYGVEGVAYGLALFMLSAIFPFWKFLINKMITVNFNDYVKALMPKFKIYYKQFVNR